MNSRCPKHDCELQRGGRQVSANENESRLTDAGTQQEGRRRRREMNLATFANDRLAIVKREPMGKIIDRTKSVGK